MWSVFRDLVVFMDGFVVIKLRVVIILFDRLFWG